ncbi:MAG: response regulator [Flavipsychrobacter sp.]|jgi:CheY-like chemotaxis protein|nr:response regulator [Flavipsychrobacter sp.]
MKERKEKRELHIFIADDDSDDRDFAIEALKDTGHEIKFSCFTNGHFLTHYFLRDFIPLLPDAIVLDLNMPLKDGYQSLKELRSLHVAKTIPIFVLTSSTMDKDREICNNLGCTGFFSKPLRSAEYKNIAQQIISAIS